MTDRRLGVPKPVPPSLEGVSAKKLELDVAGFAASQPAATTVERPSEVVPTETPRAPATKGHETKPKARKTQSKAKAATKADTDNEIRRKRNALLPHRLVPDLRDRARDDGVPHGEIVIDAFVNHIEAIRAELTADRGDAERRKKLGLPARRRRQPRVGEDEVERRVQVGLYMSQQAISVIEEAADEFGISWSYLVTLLLDRELATHPSTIGEG